MEPLQRFSKTGKGLLSETFPSKEVNTAHLITDQLQLGLRLLCSKFYLLFF